MNHLRFGCLLDTWSSTHGPADRVVHSAGSRRRGQDLFRGIGVAVCVCGCDIL